MTIDRSQRLSFDEVAGLYDEVRPGYPEALVEDVLALSSISHIGRILEVGCGPGTATLPFARRGYEMLCIELGQNLAALARRNCWPYPNVKVINTSFEDWPLEENAFDLVISAEAFHWIPPEIAYPKAAAVLKPGGTLALFWILFHDPGTDLFQAIDEVYQRQAPPLQNPDHAVTPQWVEKQITGNYKRSGCFGKVTVRRYAWSVSYSSEQYLKLLSTFSDHRKLDEASRERLFAGIGTLIERFGGSVVRHNLAVLFLARKNKG